MEWFSYLLKVMACQACFLLVYQMFLKPAGRHGWSRYSLWAVIILSFVAPLLQVQIPTGQSLPMTILEEELVIPFGQVIREVDRVPDPARSGVAISTWLIFAAIGVYLLIFLAHIVKFFMNLKVILTLTKKRAYGKLKGIKLYETDDLTPFSFFKAVFIPRELKHREGYGQIVEHELAHARHWHSLDRIMIDLIVALLWFNPFIYWYRNALKEVHEYQADEYVLKRFPDKIAYQEILYLQLFRPALGLANHFNTSLIKKRMVMMNQNRTKINQWLPLLSVPVILCISLAFTAREVRIPIDKAWGHHLDLNLGPAADLWPNLEVPETNQIPSISPIKESDRVRVSSGFGPRMDPVTQTRKHHFGIDFSAPRGTPVYATADGVVKRSGSQQNAYGVLVEIVHGDSNQFLTRYAHLESTKVKEGQRVKQGDVIATVGSSGKSFAPHLHYEIRLNGKPVDPMKYMTEKERH